MTEQVHVCIVCGWVYENSELDDGTHWHDLDDSFECPECGVGKSEFEAV
jgi:rubredoxin